MLQSCRQISPKVTEHTKSQIPLIQVVTTQTCDQEASLCEFFPPRWLSDVSRHESHVCIQTIGWCKNEATLVGKWECVSQSCLRKPALRHTVHGHARSPTDPVNVLTYGLWICFGGAAQSGRRVSLCSPTERTGTSVQTD